ncbi:hypothetical protein DACRYDRAFT_25580 [Dacryopinax primogenitus]|uniref:Uncharacterized protein n=1 Tax=Dacryopinax primogenitus (strain DJM 731) TaxID=1858805 RepID=M5FPZ6_DACPD|nr:uncharacterized protein DACRYDRAFT_25580 [Dacryopinax primogenitus]EJT96644.1 hypothetical protein DACRYDRAFT_25580 [Dacryopinax primogenitus]
MMTEHGSVGRQGHERLGATYLAELGFSQKVCELVGAHVIAKRYLTAIDKSYYESLSEASKISLRFQGGPFTSAEIEDFERDGHFRDKVALRGWDDQAKVVDLAVPELDAYRSMVLRHLRLQSSPMFAQDRK